MRKIVLAGILLALSSAAIGQTQEKKTDGYVINGVIEGNYKPNKVYLVEEEEIQGKSNVIDSAEVVNNRYTFKGGSVKYPRMYFIKSADPDCLSPITPFFLENGVINIRGNADFFLNSEAKGTPNNDIYRFYNFLNKYVEDSINHAFLLEQTIYGRGDYDTENKNFKARSALSKQRNTKVGIDMVERFPDQVFAPFVIYWSMKYRLSLDELKALRAKIDPNLNEHPYTKQLDEFIRIAAFKEGSMMPDFALPDPNGKKVSLSSFRGKYVLIDFWASWCGPCMREMPNIVKLYKECKGKDFEILGVSLDKDKGAWLNTVKEKKMRWVQVCDFEMWGTAPVKMCNVTAVPYTVLVDPNGKVIALGLRGEQLIAKIKEILGKK
ncbi:MULTISPECIES: TlpA disulfide reductase family protein [Odoribacteraceae]|uniref:TlpA disulfide reductase family protein n=1 Tax=Odoribacteraceae TaxID=1853231 RepID=UPI000E4B5773|nr:MULTISPECIES: TlpA disulfide reductase family protein [Odoribacteraceae]MCQ4875612.1 AhpC/TSA family protein [Butyricimonas paravirosa]RHR73203.1 AhpC/TSA family protein [Odoribacter sp. AF15-53]